jgi:hypothetical protein
VKTDPIPILSDELKYIQVLITCPAVAYLIDVLKQYFFGNFEYVLNKLQCAELTSLTNTLWWFSKSCVTYPTYEKIREILQLYLQGLTQQNELYLRLINTEASLEACKIRSHILDDMQQLREHIESLSKTMTVFNPEPQAIIAATVLKEHAIYLRNYGYPLGGVFDPELLHEIVENMSQLTTPQITPQITPLTSPQITPLTSPQITPLTSPQITPLTSPQITPLTSPQITPLTSPQITPLTSPQITPLTSPQISPFTTPSTTPR